MKFIFIFIDKEYDLVFFFLWFGLFIMVFIMILKFVFYNFCIFIYWISKSVRISFYIIVVIY